MLFYFVFFCSNVYAEDTYTEVKSVEELKAAVLGNIGELAKEIELKILLPENLLNTKDKIDRKYYVIRKHEDVNGASYDKIPAELAEDGKSLSFKSSKFSAYALAYEDEAVKVENPDTSDDIFGVIMLGIFAVVGFALTLRYRKFR